MTLLMQGNKERTQEPTAANKTSSRSHAVLQVTIQERNRVRTTRQSIRTGKLFMIDLAGSERASHTKVMCYDKTRNPFSLLIRHTSSVMCIMIAYHVPAGSNSIGYALE